MFERRQTWATAGLATLILAGATATRAQAEETASSVLAAAPAPSAQEPVSPLSALSVEGSQDGTTATLKFGAQANDISWLRSGTAEGHFRTASVALSAPVDEKRGFTSPLTHDGLGDAASIELQLSELAVPAADTASVDRGPACKEIRSGFEKANPGLPFPGCSTELAFKVGGKTLAEKYNAAIDAAFARRVINYTGVFGKLGRQSYTSYDPVSLAKSDADRTPWRAGVFHAWIGGRENWAITAQYAHEESFKQGDAKTACLAGAGPVLNCVSGALEPVKRVSKDILSLEARWAPAGVDLGVVNARLGVAPKIAYDAHNDDWAVALPVYLFGDKTGLTGGVRADWESKNHVVVVGVFITKSFSITGAL